MGTEIVAAALLLDGLVGDPPGFYARVPHPVAVFGGLIDRLDRGLNHEGHSFSRRRMRGVGAVLALVLATVVPAWLLEQALLALSGGWVALALSGSVLLAQRSLCDHVAAVARALDRDGLAAGRRAVSMIVGRDVACLDTAGVSRAAIESAAENFSDGVVAPAFWFTVGGLPGLVAYKAVNTADSMIGHRTPRHQAFGWAAARLDDVLNLVPARLAGLLLGLVRLSCLGTAVRAMLRDAPRHRSPNAGWPEAALAGALGLALAGPRVYHGTRVEDAWMGQGRTEATAADIHRAVALLWRAWFLLGTGMAGIAFARVLWDLPGH